MAVMSADRSKVVATDGAVFHEPSMVSPKVHIMIDASSGIVENPSWPATWSMRDGAKMPSCATLSDAGHENRKRIRSREYAPPGKPFFSFVIAIMRKLYSFVLTFYPLVCYNVMVPDRTLGHGFVIINDFFANLRFIKFAFGFILELSVLL
jgi:hypothetical protein